jgi:predicted NBD/HSP70 family sugar kinase
MKKLNTANLLNANPDTESRQLKQLRVIIRYLSKSAVAHTLPEVAEHVKISVPTVTKLVKELVDRGLVIEEGKKETDNGRKPTVYTLDKTKFFAVGVEILSKWIHVSVVRIDLETVHESLSRSFRLEDSPECLEYIIKLIQETILESDVKSDQILGVGIALRGHVNCHTGVSANYFTQLGMPLRAYLNRNLGLPVIIDNDTRVIGISEQVLGDAKGVENALIVKVSRNLGVSIILDRNIIFGAKGYSGNLNHMQFGEKKRLCECGKRGCLRTEVSGYALQLDLMKHLEDGEQSIYFNNQEVDSYTYHDVLDAVLKGDALSIDLIVNQGEILGRALGNLINLLNPNLIVIGGEFVMVKDYFIDAIRAGMRKTGLTNSLQDCEVLGSKLGRYFSSRGAACMVLKNNELINY